MEEVLKLSILRMELKYCEACGALWLRAPQSETPYCMRCEEVMREMAHALPEQGRRA